MPCRDYYDDHPEQYYKDVTVPSLKNQISFAESALCGALTALDRIINEHNSGKKTPYAPALHQIDFDAIGININDLEKWWKNHKKLDEKHRKEELRKNAIAKLTKEERDALGVK